MQRFLPGLLALVFFAGCGTSPINSETTRNTVLQYLGGQVGTAGPFGKGGKKELDVLASADRIKVEEMIDRGAVIFLVYGGTAGGASNGASRVVVVEDGKIAGDFFAQPQTGAAK